MKSIRVLAAAGLVAAFGASEAFAWSGDLIKCNPTPGNSIIVSFGGLSCKEAKVKIGIKTDVAAGQGFDGCVANPAAPWDAWVDGKWGKTSAASAATIEQFSISLKGQTFGSCNFGGSDVSSGASGSGAITFFDSTGAVKVKGASLKFFGKVAGDVATYSATASGLVTKGIGLGGDLALTIGLDLANPLNTPVLACNAGGTCLDPNDPADPGNLNPVTQLAVITNASSEFIITLGSDDPNDPNDYNALP